MQPGAEKKDGLFQQQHSKGVLLAVWILISRAVQELSLTFDGLDEAPERDDGVDAHRQVRVSQAVDDALQLRVEVLHVLVIDVRVLARNPRRLEGEAKGGDVSNC